jgi:hypothetical protein
MARSIAPHALDILQAIHKSSDDGSAATSPPKAPKKHHFLKY